MGQEACSITELQTQGKSVLPPRYTNNVVLTYSLQGTIEIVGVGRSTPMPQREDWFHYIRNAFHLSTPQHATYVGSGVTASLQSGILDRSFQRGDIVGTLCCRPNDPSFDFPFLVQTNCSKYLGLLAHDSAPSLWCVIAAVRLGEISDMNHTYVALRKCLPVVGPVPLPTPNYAFTRYRVDTTGHVSFAHIDQSMRKVGTMYDCPDEPHLSAASSNFLECPQGRISGAIFQAVTRADGFPPRQG